MKEDSESFDEDVPGRVHRKGDWVHRPVGPWTPAVNGLLDYLEDAGFPYSPRVGVQESEKQVVSYIEGLHGARCWAMINTDDGLARFARLLREYHDAVRGYRPPAQARWAHGTSAVPGVGQLVCHGDFAPWNVVWGADGSAKGIIDWDFAFPAVPTFDVWYAMDWSVPLRDDQTCLDWHHFHEVPDRRHRAGVFLDAYGISSPRDLVSGVARVRRHTSETEAALAAEGVEPQAGWVAAGHLEHVESVTRWIEAHRDLFQ